MGSVGDKVIRRTTSGTTLILKPLSKCSDNDVVPSILVVKDSVKRHKKFVINLKFLLVFLFDITKIVFLFSCVIVDLFCRLLRWSMKKMMMMMFPFGFLRSTASEAAGSTTCDP